MKSLVFSLFASILLIGCMQADAPTTDRGPLGKADSFGSCASADGDFCGDISDGNCWCDDKCESFGDCCPDKAKTCDGALGCGDGSVALCEIVVAPCEDGLVREIVNHCFGACVDPVTCEPPLHQECGDGSELHPLCDIAPVCAPGEVKAVFNGCFECVNPVTCLPAPEPVDSCCSLDDQPEFPFEPVECCEDGSWQMTGSGSPCSDVGLEVGTVCEPEPAACCSPDDFPEFAFEPVQCCEDGTWQMTGSGSPCANLGMEVGAVCE